MQTFKKILHAILLPHVAITVLLSIIATVCLAYTAINLAPDNPISIISYVLSAYALTLICFRIPDMIKLFKHLKNENKYVTTLRGDVQLRVKLSLYGTLIFNAVYAVFQLCLGFYHGSVWFFSLFFYYILLAAMRFFLLQYTRKHGAGENMKTEFKRARICGILLLIMNLALAGIVIYIVWQFKVIKHHEITTIALAAYTFTALTLAIVNIFRYRKYSSPLFSLTKAISFASALVSLFTLESTMLTVFSAEDTPEGFEQIMSALTGGAIMLMIISMAIATIIKSTKELKKLTKDDNER